MILLVIIFSICFIIITGILYEDYSISSWLINSLIIILFAILILLKTM